MNFIKFGFPILSLMLGSLPTYADANHGKALQDQSCTTCHNTSVYSRPNKRIKSLAALKGQVSRCTKPAGAEWSNEDIKDVVEYLNRDFYHFK